MSDDEVVASDVPRGTCFTSSHTTYIDVQILMSDRIFVKWTFHHLHLWLLGDSSFLDQIWLYYCGNGTHHFLADLRAWSTLVRDHHDRHGHSHRLQITVPKCSPAFPLSKHETEQTQPKNPEDLEPRWTQVSLYLRQTILWKWDK